MKPVTGVEVVDEDLAVRLGGLLAVLQGLLPVRFDDTLAGGAQARITTVTALAAETGAAPRVPTLVLPHAGLDDGCSTLRRQHIRFADDRRVPWPFRGRSVDMCADIDVDAMVGRPEPADITLATTREGQCVWSVNDSSGVAVHRTSLCPPHANAGLDIGLAAAGERFIQSLPLWQFLRELTQGQRYVDPPLRAAFIIDDPNLHWPHYGFADYRDIAADAQREHYHVAFATIPLDAWWVHRATAEIFRQRQRELSLLVHGNNHAAQELAQERTSQACGALLRQADSRIRQLEMQSGLQVSRVMIPPHGACSSRMLGQLPRQGFEAACISAGSLRAHNAGQPWTRTLGLAPSEWVEGCPVLPRWAFGGTTDMQLLTAAYLGQPLLLRGHHQDLRDGLEILRGFARAIHALGEVRWCNLGDISRMNYRHRIEGSVMHIQPLALRIDVSVPEGVSELRIESGGFDWRSLDALAVPMERNGHALRMATAGRPSCSLGVRRDEPRDDAPKRDRATSPKLLLRRAFTEARDRLSAF